MGGNPSSTNHFFRSRLCNSFSSSSLSLFPKQVHVFLSLLYSTMYSPPPPVRVLAYFVPFFSHLFTRVLYCTCIVPVLMQFFSCKIKVQWNPPKWKWEKSKGKISPPKFLFQMSLKKCPHWSWVLTDFISRLSGSDCTSSCVLLRSLSLPAPSDSPGAIRERQRKINGTGEQDKRPKKSPRLDRDVRGI